MPYFTAGLRNNEQCLWVTGQAFNADDARSALRNAVPDLDKRERGKQIEIVNGDEWYAAGEKLRPRELVSGLVQREQDALGAGYSGLRTSGNCAWVSSEQLPDFLDYEALVQKAVRGRRMICMCNYCVDKVDGSILEIMGRHDLTVPTTRPETASRTGSNNTNPHSPGLVVIRPAIFTGRLTPSSKPPPPPIVPVQYGRHADYLGKAPSMTVQASETDLPASN
ncbi:hypothetical protein ABIF63_000265 [Bradyrhizobium japonicum]|uniref:MEDS domain-containing protein n=1 Tax=Bradyrhizobium japonicum TaxID=375 RepID=A0ABV2RGV0_BRAJP